MGLVRNLPTVNRNLDVWVERVRHTHIENYRYIVRKLFRRILLKTPQATGRAVAHWNIGIDAPAEYFNPEAGDEGIDVTSGTHSGGRLAGLAKVRSEPRHQRGDRKWVNIAWARNEPKFALIKINTRVFITNSALGDDDGGRSSEFYVDSLQDASYWMKKLRRANQPYETVEETMLAMAEQLGRREGLSFILGDSPSDR